MSGHEKNELVNHRMSNARKALLEVDVLIENQLWNLAINRLYYACFYAVCALLLFKDVKSRTHNGAIQMLGKHFVSTGLIPQESGSFYSTIYSMRHKGDYEDFVVYEQGEVVDKIESARTFIDQVENLLNSMKANES